MNVGSLTKNLQETLDLFEAGGEPNGTNEIAERLDLGRRSTYDRLARLADDGFLETKKIGASARVWWRPNTDTASRPSATNGESAVEPADSDAEVGVQTGIPVEAVLDSAEVGVFVLDADFRVAWINDAVERYFGLDRAEVVGKDKRELVRNRIRDTIADADTFVETVLATYDDNTYTEEFGCQILPGEGRQARWLEHRSRPIETGPYAGGRVEVYYDITERKRTKRLLKRQRDDLESELAEIFERIDEAFFGLDEELRFVYVNDRAIELLEMEGSVVGRDIRDASEPTETFENALLEALESQEPIFLEDYYGPTDTWFENAIYPSQSGLSVYFHDITERKKAEESLTALYNSARELLAAESAAEIGEVIVETATDVLDLSGVVTYCFDEATDRLYPAAKSVESGFIREELPSVPPDDSSITGNVYATGEPLRLDDITTSPHFQSNATEMQSGIFAPMGSHGVLIVGSQEIGAFDERTQHLVELLAANAEAAFDRVEHQRALEESEQRYRALVENFPNGAVALLDDELRFTLIEGRGFDKLDHTASDLLGKRIQDVFSGDDLDIVEPNYRAALDGDATFFEIEVQGRAFEVRVLPLTGEAGDVYAIMAMSQDVTERKERERELERHVRQQEVIADLGHFALEDRDLDALMEAAVQQVAETLDIDYCKILELNEEASKLRVCQGVGWDDGVVGTATVSAVEDGSQAAYTLTTEQPVVVEDLQTDTRFSVPELLLDHDVRSGISTIIGSHDDPWGILGAHDTAPRSYSEQDVTFVQSIANILATAIARHHHVQELIRQREQLAALDNVNTIVREITDAVIEQSTREEIEEIVCEHLAASDSYLFAWIGDVDMHSETVTLRTEAGVEGYLDGVTISVDPEDERSAGPTGRAILNREIQVTNDIRAESGHDPWREHVETYGFRSSAAIPIVHEGTLYGVLNVYAERPDAFTGEERAVISQLGEVVGHAIAAVERKRALMSDEVVELEFQIQNVADAFDFPGGVDGTVELHQAVPIGDGNFLEYGIATGDGMQLVEAFVGSDAFPQWESVSVLEERDDETRFELRFSEPPVLSMIATHGGNIREAKFEDGNFYMRIHLTQSTDIRRVVEVIAEAYPALEMVTQRKLSRDRQSTLLRGALFEELTDRQRAALEAAYYAGFFEWPRDTTGEAVAASLAVSPSTFHQHLRKAQQKVLAAAFEKVE